MKGEKTSEESLLMVNKLGTLVTLFPFRPKVQLTVGLGWPSAVHATISPLELVNVAAACGSCVKIGPQKELELDGELISLIALLLPYLDA